METQPYFGYVSTLSLKSTLIINELYFSPWPRPDGSLVAIAGDACGGFVTLPETLASENSYSAWR